MQTTTTDHDADLCPCGTRLPSLDPEDYPTGFDMYVANPYSVRAAHREHRAAPSASNGR